MVLGFELTIERSQLGRIEIPVQLRRVCTYTGACFISRAALFGCGLTLSLSAWSTIILGFNCLFALVLWKSGRSDTAEEMRFEISVNLTHQF